MTLQEIYNSQTDKTSVSLSNQSLQFELDELGLKSRYNQDLKYVEESQRNIKEQDRLAEESFKKLFDFDTNKSQSKQFDYLADREIKGDYSLEEKKDIFKNRFHNIWSSLGKPIFKMSNMFGSKDTDGRWYAQNRKDFTVPYKMKNKETINSFNINDLFKVENLKDKYERRYGGMESYDDWDTSNKYRKDLIKIKNRNSTNRIRTAIEELTHQMQGRQLVGDDVEKIRNEAFSQRRINNKYSNPKTIEYHAHKTLGKVIKSAIKGDKKAFDSIKSKSYNDYFGNSVLK